jgi:hypothetical protein
MTGNQKNRSPPGKAGGLFYHDDAEAVKPAINKLLTIVICLANKKSGTLNCYREQ